MKPYLLNQSQNYTTSAPLTTSTHAAFSPFRFTFSSTVRANPSTTIANQVTSSTPLGPLQQKYQQSNYNNNFASYRVPTTTTTTTTTTISPNNFNNLFSTPSAYTIGQRPIVSSPQPFNSNNNVNTFARNQIQNNNNLLNNNFTKSQQNGKSFDNHNPINNYQTTSPFANQQPIFSNKKFPLANFNGGANNTATKLVPSSNNNQFAQTTKSPFNNQQNFGNANFYQSTNNNNQRSNGQSERYISTTTTPKATTQDAISSRNPMKLEPPNFNHQDFINQYNLKQQQLVQTNRRFEDQTRLTAEQRRLQLHYDINDYLTTDKYTTNSRYSPTSEQYRSIQTFSADQSTRSNFQAKNAIETFTQNFNAANNDKYQTQSSFSIPSTTISSKQQYDTFKYQTQQDRPLQRSQSQAFVPITNEQNVLAVKASQLGQVSPRQLINEHVSEASSSNAIPSVKKFSTLVPKESFFAPTTFKPAFYFNVAKQINDNLSTPLRTVGNSLSASTPIKAPSTTTTTTTTTVRPISVSFNRNLEPARGFNFNQPQSVLPTQTNPTEIDENDGQYHPELYEKDFARYKIKNRKKQDRQKLQPINKTFNNLEINRGFHRNSGTSSTEEEFLNTAYSQNIAASGNELFNTKNSRKSGKQTQNTVKTAIVNPITTTTTTTTKKTLPAQSSVDKDVSYDYAYYDSANDTPNEYSEFDSISDFSKTKSQRKQ